MIYKKYIILFLFFLRLSDSLAQISTELLHVIPKEYKPLNKNNLTVQEKQNILFNSYLFTSPLVENELDKLALDLERNTNQIYSDIDLQSKLALSSYFYFPKMDHRSSMRNILMAQQYLQNDFTRLDDKSLMLMYNLSNNYCLLGRQDSAFKYCNIIMSEFEKRKNKEGVGLGYSSLGYIYRKLGNFEKAVENISKYLESYNQKNIWDFDYTSEFVTRINYYILLAKSTGNSNLMQKARIDIDILKIKKAGSINNWYGPIFYFEGFLHYNNGKYTEAIEAFDKSLRPQFNSNDSFFKNSTFKQFYRALSLMKLTNGKEGKSILDTLDLNHDYIRLKLKYETLYDYYRSKGDKAKTLDSYILFRQYSDSLDIIKQQGTIFEAEQKYNVAKKELIIQKMDSEQKKTFLIYTYVLLMVVVAASLAFIRANNNNNKRKKILAQLNELTESQVSRIKFAELNAKASERKIIGQELHDDLAGSIASLKINLELEANKEENKFIKPVLQKLAKQSDIIYEKARGKSHTWFDANNKNIAFQTHIEDIISKALPLDKFQTNITIDKNTLEIIDTGPKIELIYIIQEAIVNILKHANATKIDLLLYEEWPNILLQITDNGNGFQKKKNKKGMGILSMEKRAQKIGGNFKFNSNNSGTELEVRFPINNENEI